jgi:hypothetical protein
MGRPGLLGTAMRTAVIAGTAQATTGAMQRRRAEREQQDWAAQQAAAQQEQARVEAAAQQAAAQYAAAPPPGPLSTQASSGGQDLLGQLERLGQLHTAGVVTAEEFAAAKAKLLA